MATKQKSKKNLYIITTLAILIVGLLGWNIYTTPIENITKDRFEKLVENNKITNLSIDDKYLYIKTPTQNYKIYKDSINIPLLSYSYPIDVKETTQLYIGDILFVVFMALIILYIIRLSTKNRLQQIELNRAYDSPELIQDIKPIHSSVKFDDVAGIDMVKEELEEIIDFLKYPSKYKQMGIRMPKGVLLVGPPGVGKTLVAKAVAGEANVPFFYQSGASFTQIYVGMGAKRVSELFAQAKKNAPSIIFIDEIDAVGKSRRELGNDEREATLNELLTQMDGFEDSSGVIVIGATNKIDVLDDALLRSGRFDRRVHLSLPNLEDRKEILKLYLQNKMHNVDIEHLARATVGFSAAALDTLVNEAALYALRDNRKVLLDSDFEAVKEKVISGKRHIQSYLKEEKKIQALYQAAKAVVASWLSVDYDKISLVTTTLEELDHEITSRTVLLNKAKVYLAGATVCKQEYNEYFSNAKDDIQVAKEIISQILDKYAMTENFLAQPDNSLELFKTTLKELEELVSQLKPAIDKVSLYLLEYESISHSKCKDIIDEIF